MKHTELTEIPARMEEITVKVTCDLCGSEIPQYGVHVDRVTITRNTGRSYLEGGSGDTFSVDMCGNCFESKLTPWLESQGVKLQVEEWGY